MVFSSQNSAWWLVNYSRGSVYQFCSDLIATCSKRTLLSIVSFRNHLHFKNQPFPKRNASAVEQSAFKCVKGRIVFVLLLVVRTDTKNVLLDLNIMGNSISVTRSIRPSFLSTPVVLSSPRLHVSLGLPLLLFPCVSNLSNNNYDNLCLSHN